MKNKAIAIVLALLLVASVGGNIYFYTQNQKQAEQIVEYGKLYSPMYDIFSTLTVPNFEEKVASGERFTVYVGRPDCSDCNTFEPMFEELIEELSLANKMYYMNVRDFRAADWDQWTAFKDKYGFTQTPAFLTFEKGKLVDMTEWSDKGLPKSELKAWLLEQKLV